MLLDLSQQELKVMLRFVDFVICGFGAQRERLNRRGLRICGFGVAVYMHRHGFGRTL